MLLKNLGYETGGIVMYKTCDTAVDNMENLSVLIKDYSKEIANTVQMIANKYNVSMEFALLVVQTGIEEMKMDVEHHKNYLIDDLAKALNHMSQSFREISIEIPDALKDSADRISNAIESAVEDL